MINNKTFFIKAASFLLVALVASGSLFASDADVSGSLVRVGVAQDGMVGMLAEEAGVAAPVAIDVTENFAGEVAEMYLSGANLAEYGAVKVELAQEELDALSGSAKIVEAVAVKFGVPVLDAMGVSLDDGNIKALTDAYKGSFDAIKAGEVTRADVFAVAGVAGLFSELDAMTFDTVDGGKVALVDYFLAEKGTVAPLTEEAADAIAYDLVGAALYFDMVLGCYNMPFGLTSLFPVPVV